LFSLEETYRRGREKTPPPPEIPAFFRANLPSPIGPAPPFAGGEGGGFVIGGKNKPQAQHPLPRCHAMWPHQTCIDTNKSKLGLLVTRRNGIAHGEDVVVKDLTEYKQYEDAALVVMHDLAVAVVDALDNKTYLKPP